ncbi:MAG: hypothetical protein NT141_01450 [candidate division WWE3 bacterium]|nr:hypothetical protein [candidate division WWE3 bacterium]
MLDKNKNMGVTFPAEINPLNVDSWLPLLRKVFGNHMISVIKIETSGNGKPRISFLQSTELRNITIVREKDTRAPCLAIYLELLDSDEKLWPMPLIMGVVSVISTTDCIHITFTNKKGVNIHYTFS